ARRGDVPAFQGREADPGERVRQDDLPRSRGPEEGAGAVAPAVQEVGSDRRVKLREDSSLVLRPRVAALQDVMVAALPLLEPHPVDADVVVIARRVGIGQECHHSTRSDRRTTKLSSRGGSESYGSQKANMPPRSGAAPGYC